MVFQPASLSTVASVPDCAHAFFDLGFQVREGDKETVAVVFAKDPGEIPFLIPFVGVTTSLQV